jgi:hypothetical protein
MGTGGPGQIALSADGSVVAVLFLQGQLAVHRVADQALILQIPNAFGPPLPHEDGVPPPPAGDHFFDQHVVSLARDGSSVTVQDQTHVAKWAIPLGDQVFDVHASYVATVFAPDDSAFMGVTTLFGPDTRVDLRDGNTGAMIHQYSVPNVRAVGFAAGGHLAQFVVSPCPTGESCAAIVSYAADDTGTLVSTVLLAPDDPIPTGRFSATGRYFAGFIPRQDRPDYKDLDVIDVSDGHRVLLAAVDSDYLAFSPDDAVIETFSPRTTALNVAVRVSTGEIRGVPGTYYATAAAAASRGAPAFTLDGSGVYWTNDTWTDANAAGLGPSARFPTLAGQGFSFMAASIAPDGNTLATASYDERMASDDVIIWNLRTREGRRLETGSPVFNVAVSPNSDRVLLSKPYPQRGSLQEWSLESSTRTRLIDVGIASVWNAVYAPDGQEIAAVLDNGIGILAPTAQAIDPTIAVGEPGLGVAYTRDGSRLAVSGPALWQVSDRRKLWPTDDPGPTFYAEGDNWVAVSPDGDLLLTSDFQSSSPPPWDNVGDTYLTDENNYSTQTRIYRVGSTSLTLVNDLGTALPRRPVFSPDGAWVVAGNYLWSVESTGIKMLPLSTAHGLLSVSTIGPDGTIAVGRQDGVVELFCPN